MPQPPYKCEPQLLSDGYVVLDKDGQQVASCRSEVLANAIAALLDDVRGVVQTLERHPADNLPVHLNARGRRRLIEVLGRLATQETAL